MKPSGFILTGLRKYRNRSHSPHILDYSRTNDWLGFDAREAAFSDYEGFEVCPATKAVIYRLAENKLSESQKKFSIENFSVWSHPKRGSIVCTESDYLFAKTITSITARSQTLATALRRTFTYSFKQLLLTMRGPIL